MHSIFFAKNVSKSFEHFRLEDVSFEVKEGVIVGVIGKNGSGKSTLFNMLMGAISSDSAAEIRINDCSLLTDEKNYKKKIAYIFPESPFNDGLSAVSNGKYYGRYYNHFDREKYEALLDKFEITQKEGPVKSVEVRKKNHASIRTLSQGQNIRQQLAFALSYDAQVYFFDEPAGNLDVEFRDEFYDIVRTIVSERNKCVIYATQLVEELEHFADYILWLREEDGVSRVFYYGTADELREQYRMISGDSSLMQQLPEKWIVGGRNNVNTKEVLISYSKDLEMTSELKSGMRYADLKEIMYYVEKNRVMGCD